MMIMMMISNNNKNKNNNDNSDNNKCNSISNNNNSMEVIHQKLIVIWIFGMILQCDHSQKIAMALQEGKPTKWKMAFQFRDKVKLSS